MNKTDIRTWGHLSGKETSLRETIFNLYQQCPIPPTEILTNLGIFLNRQALSRMLFMNLLYQKIIDVHGIIIEFGVRWGQNLALFESFRGMYEPFNYYRKIVGFDTFAGFPATDAKDGNHAIATTGAYAVTDKYEEYLEQILDYHEQESPLSHIKKYELVKGDASIEVNKYLERNPETIVALAYFDFDIYQPTKKCLEAIKDRLTKGSVIGFDELNCHEFPGETTAFKEVFGLDRFRINRSPLCPTTSYVVID